MECILVSYVNVYFYCLFFLESIFLKILLVFMFFFYFEYSLYKIYYIYVINQIFMKYLRFIQMQIVININWNNVL